MAGKNVYEMTYFCRSLPSHYCVVSFDRHFIAENLEGAHVPSGRGTDADVPSANIAIHSAWRMTQDVRKWRCIIEKETPQWGKGLFCSVFFFSRPRFEGWPHHESWTYFLHLYLSSVILIDFSTDSPVQVLMLSIQAVRGLCT